ncbi:alpha/beta-hydrolase [Thozetella sp. PMI_491]|nr:alpha/beta-hydrolase [Thozetella sp. PMI_491]
MESKIIAQAKVSPHWLPGGDTFWYKHQISDGNHDFVFVDALNKTRQAGFDHMTLAQYLQRSTKRTVDPNSLLGEEPGEWRGPLDNKGMKGKFLSKEVPSPFAARTVAVTFVNRGSSSCAMQWIDHAGEPGDDIKVGPAKSKRVVTWSGHIWRLVDEGTGAAMAVYAAPKEEDEDVVIIEDGMDKAGEKNEEHTQALKTAMESETPAEFPRVFVHDFNVCFASEDGDQQQISRNGTKDNPYDEDRVYLSPDKHFAVVWQYTPEQDHKVHLVESSPADQLQPKLKTLQYLKPGDRVRIDRPRLFNLAQRAEVPTESILFQNPYELMNIGWSKNSGEYRFIFNERGHQNLRIIGISQDGQVRTLVEEKSKTFIDYSCKLYRFVMNETDELLWTSERDGWNHIYLYDLENGSLKNQVTRGEWVVNSVEKVDQEKRQLWFSGYGMISGQDPYYAHLARINFDGSGLKILTEGDGTHVWKWSPDGRYLVDTWSRVDCPPTTILRNGATGDKVLTLQESALSDLLASGWNGPERFVAPGRDGTTPIYGIIIRPSDFDPTQKYPILEDIYAGPQGFWTTKAFSRLATFREWADKGYVVVKLDGMGTNWRRKAFHDVCYKQLQDAGFPDRIAWIQAAAKQRPWMDVSRVGVKGTSAGGQNAGSALIFHGDFYKVAAADSGCHDNRMDKIWWNEQWMGWPVDKSYEDSSNVVNADKLQGNIMLIVGELDDNVDPSTTLQFANALTKADKDYDLVLIPGGKHGCGYSAHGQKKQLDFFDRHLKG